MNPPPTGIIRYSMPAGHFVAARVLLHVLITSFVPKKHRKQPTTARIILLSTSKNFLTGFGNRL